MIMADPVYSVSCQCSHIILVRCICLVEVVLQTILWVIRQWSASLLAYYHAQVNIFAPFIVYLCDNSLRFSSELIINSNCWMYYHDIGFRSDRKKCPVCHKYGQAFLNNSCPVISFNSLYNMYSFILLRAVVHGVTQDIQFHF